jgi:hypothetical protein
MKTSTLKLIFSHTSGHCHFCGDRLIFSRRFLEKARLKRARGRASTSFKRTSGRNTVNLTNRAAIKYNSVDRDTA